MTLEALLSDKSRYSQVWANGKNGFFKQDDSPYINLETYLQPTTESESYYPIREEVGRIELWTKQRRLVLAQSLEKLSDGQLPGEEHVEEYLRDQYRRHCSCNTMRHSVSTLRLFLSFIGQRGKDGVEGISRQDIEAFVEHEQDRGMKPLTVHARLRTVKAFMGHLIEKEVVGPEVVSRRMTVKVPDALPRAMDPDDVGSLLGVLDRVRDRAMVLVLLRTGMRIGELLTTLLRDIHLKERRIEIYEAQKTGMGRVVYMSDDAVAALGAWVGERKEGDAYLFHGRGGKPLCYEAARKSFEICLGKAGLSQKGYTLHCLRHTFATDLLNAGMRLEYLQALLGHNSIEMTRRYARLTDKSREEEYFKAMAMIERGERDGHDRFDR